MFHTHTHTHKWKAHYLIMILWWWCSALNDAFELQFNNLTIHVWMKKECTVHEQITSYCN